MRAALGWSSGGIDGDLGSAVEGREQVVRAGDHLTGHGNCAPSAVEVETICELTFPVDAGRWVDGAEKVPVRGVNGGEDRPRPLGGLGGRQIPGLARLRIDGVHDDGDSEPGSRGKPRLGRGVERCDGRVDLKLNIRSGAGRRRDDVRICPDVIGGQVWQRLVGVGVDAAGISGHGLVCPVLG